MSSIKKDFTQLEKSFPDYISYGGAIEANKSVETLKSYFTLLFPTYYKRRGLCRNRYRCHVSRSAGDSERLEI